MRIERQPAERLFYHLLGNNLIAGVTNNFIWFALTFWVILETKSVVAAAYIAGIFSIINIVGAIFFGSFVDHHRKKTVMLASSVISGAAYFLSTLLYFHSSLQADSIEATSPTLWVMVSLILIGAVAGNLRTIALTTSVSLLFAENKDTANGLIGTMNGISFSLTSVLSGLIIGFFGFGAALIVSLIATIVAFAHLMPLFFPETIRNGSHAIRNLDIRGTFAIIKNVPGLFSLILFHTFNNLLGGVFMALMDIYGLSLVTVETWGILWGVASAFMIAGGLLVARHGVGKNPVRSIMVINLITWGTCIIFPIQASILLLTLGMFTWMFFFPIVEAAEQTVIQHVVPTERQGRVFGFAQSVESTATPLTAFAIGPITQLFFIPFMTTGAGVSLIGEWFGTGDSRGIALVFIAAGSIGVLVTTIAFSSRAYRHLHTYYEQSTAALPH